VSIALSTLNKNSSFRLLLQDDLYEYCFRVKRTIREVLTEFRSARVPREYVFDLFPPMRPRLFSIASSIKVGENCLQERISHQVSTGASERDTSLRGNCALQNEVEDSETRGVHIIFG